MPATKEAVLERLSAVVSPDGTPLPASGTLSDIVVSESFDSGRTWGTPTVLARAGDQFMPWGAYDTSGKLRIGFFDRNDAANHTYAYSLATQTTASPLAFKRRRHITTAAT